MEKLTVQEEDAMVLIWQHAPCVVRDVLAFYPEPRPPYTTLASVFKNLERKGYIEARKVGIVYEYTPLLSMREYKSVFLEDWVQTYCEGSYKQLLAFLVNDQRLSRKELKETYKMMEKDGKKS
jgi:BlaI family penicillinase repressor